MRLLKLYTDYNYETDSKTNIMVIEDQMNNNQPLHKPIPQICQKWEFHCEFLIFVWTNESNEQANYIMSYTDLTTTHKHKNTET